MNARLRKSVLLLCLMALTCLLAVTPRFAYAQESSAETEEKGFGTFFNTLLNRRQDEAAAVQRQETLNQAKEVRDQLNYELRARSSEFYNLRVDMADHEDALEETQTKIGTLQEQLDNLDYHILMTEKQITNVEQQIIRKQNEIELLYKDIEKRETELHNQRRTLADYLNFLYKEQNNYYDQQEEHFNALRLLLADASVSETLQTFHYLQVLEDAGQQIFSRLEFIRKKLEEDKKVLLDHEERLQNLNQQLKNQQRYHRDQKLAKQDLLEDTKGEEQLYQKLIKLAAVEQEQILLELSALRTNISYVSERINNLDDNWNPKEYERRVAYRRDLAKTLNIVEGFVGDTLLEWPVLPKRGLSAYFHDPAYRAHFGFTHNAIDIPVPQGTPVHAPAPGVVYKVRENGFGYSYIVIAHKNDLMTLYGHMSRMLVEEGDIVSIGEIIGFSGGMPGTVGAGLLTTGPHLHFEVMQDGTHVDPLAFLPLEMLPQSTFSILAGKEEEPEEN